MPTLHHCPWGTATTTHLVQLPYALQWNLSLWRLSIFDGRLVFTSTGSVVYISKNFTGVMSLLVLLKVLSPRPLCFSPMGHASENETCLGNRTVRQVHLHSCELKTCKPGSRMGEQTLILILEQGKSSPILWLARKRTGATFELKVRKEKKWATKKWEG